MTRRQKAIAFVVTFCVVLVAAAVSLNVSWIVINARRVTPLVLGILPKTDTWEMATIGSRGMDLGTTLAYWVEADDDARLQMLAFGPTALPGMLRRSELVECYAQRSGRPIARPEYFRVFGLFKIGVIIQQIFARYQRGSTADPRFAGLGQVVEILARIAGEAAGSGRL